jgi:uncharacterized phage-associated protein
MTPRLHPEKVRQAIAHIASKLPERQNMYKVLKVMYFAEKCHLRKYGRVIFGGRYLAMKHGPVPWSAYRKVSDERDSRERADKEPLYRVEKDHTIVPLLNPELEYFSESDLECINEEIETCRPLTFAQLKKRSHDPAYKGAAENDEMSLESIASAAAGTDEERRLLLEHLTDA